MNITSEKLHKILQESINGLITETQGNVGKSGYDPTRRVGDFKMRPSVNPNAPRYFNGDPLWDNEYAKNDSRGTYRQRRWGKTPASTMKEEEDKEWQNAYGDNNDKIIQQKGSKANKQFRTIKKTNKPTTWQKHRDTSMSCEYADANGKPVGKRENKIREGVEGIRSSGFSDFKNETQKAEDSLRNVLYISKELNLHPKWCKGFLSALNIFLDTMNKVNNYQLGDEVGM